MARDSTIRSSLPLQMLLSYHVYWTWIFFILTLAVYIWKGAAVGRGSTRRTPERAP